jgi:hypothetical protein
MTHHECQSNPDTVLMYRREPKDWREKSSRTTAVAVSTYARPLLSKRFQLNVMTRLNSMVKSVAK